MKHQQRAAVAAFGLAVLTVLGACGSSSKSSSKSATASASTAAASAATAAPGADTGTIKVGTGSSPIADPSAQQQTAPLVPDSSRALIVTADLHLKAADVGATVNALTTIAIGQGGNVYNSQVQLEAPASASVQLRVPPSKLAETETLIGKLGTVTGLTQQVQDVTEAAADLDARTRTAQASVDRVRGFLDKATSVADLASIEAQVTQRETTLEQLQAQQRTMADQTALSTLTVDITGPQPAVISKQSSIPSVRDGLKGGLRAFVTVAAMIGLALAATLPFAVVTLLIGFPIWRLVKRPRRVQT